MGGWFIAYEAGQWGNECHSKGAKLFNPNNDDIMLHGLHDNLILNQYDLPHQQSTADILWGRSYSWGTLPMSAVWLLSLEVTFIVTDKRQATGFKCAVVLWKSLLKSFGLELSPHTQNYLCNSRICQVDDCPRASTITHTPHCLFPEQ